MTVLWLIIWLIMGTPAVTFSGGEHSGLSTAAVTLVICAAIDLFGVLSRD